MPQSGGGKTTFDEKIVTREELAGYVDVGPVERLMGEKVPQEVCLAIGLLMARGQWGRFLGDVGDGAGCDRPRLGSREAATILEFIKAANVRRRPSSASG